MEFKGDNGTGETPPCSNCRPLDAKQNSYLENLKKHILPLSESKDFNIAKLEWKLDYIKKTKELGKCPCSHPIKEHCYIKNKKNHNTTHVGNECIKKFMDIDTGTLFAGLQRINRDQTSKPNAALIKYAYERGYLYDNQHQFLLDIKSKKRPLTEKQKNFLKKINYKILNDIVVRCLPD